MGLILNLLILVIVGGLLYWIVTLLPLPSPFKTIAIVVLLVLFILVLLNWFTGYMPLGRYG